MPVTINSDDPKAMNVTLSGEFEKVSRSLDWRIADVEAATRRAVAAAFCDEDRSAALHRQIDDHVRALRSADNGRDGDA